MKMIGNFLLVKRLVALLLIMLIISSFLQLFLNVTFSKNMFILKSFSVTSLSCATHAMDHVLYLFVYIYGLSIERKTILIICYRLNKVKAFRKETYTYKTMYGRWYISEMFWQHQSQLKFKRFDAKKR